MFPAALPIPQLLHVEALLLNEDGLTILASSEASDAPCPLCGERAARVHSRFLRTIADLPWADAPSAFGSGCGSSSATTPSARARSSPSARPGSTTPTPAAPTAKGSG